MFLLYRDTLITYGGRHLLVWGNALISIEEGIKLVCRETLMHINKGKAYGRQGKAPTGLISDPI